MEFWREMREGPSKPGEGTGVWAVFPALTTPGRAFLKRVAVGLAKLFDTRCVGENERGASSFEKVI